MVFLLGFLHFFPTTFLQPTIAVRTGCSLQDLGRICEHPSQPFGESRFGRRIRTAQFFVEFAQHPQQKDAQCAMNDYVVSLPCA